MRDNPLLTAGGVFLEAPRHYQCALEVVLGNKGRSRHPPARLRRGGIGSQRLDLARLFGGVECVLQLLCIAVLGFPKSPDIS